MTALQSLEALKVANEMRSGMAEFRRSIAELPQHEGVVAVAEAIETRHDEPLLGAIRIKTLLTSIDLIGDAKARKMLMLAGVLNHDKRLRDLTERQRHVLVGALEWCGWRRKP